MFARITSYGGYNIIFNFSNAVIAKIGNIDGIIITYSYSIRITKFCILCFSIIVSFIIRTSNSLHSFF